jgi:hypothetical protein
MMLVVRQSTARTCMIGPVLDASGAAVTDCVVADFEGSVNGGDPVALNGSATLTHRGVGFYSLALTATDLATVGSFEVTINDTVNACAIKELTVIEEAVYDAIYAASANGFAGAAGASTVTFSNTAIATVTTATNVTTVNGLAAGVITAASIATGAIDADALAADAGTEIGTAVWATTTRLLTAGTNIVLAKGTGVTGFNDLSAAQVNAEADTALADYDGPTNAEMVARTLASASYATATALQTVDDNVDAILVDTGTDIPASIAALPTAAGNADAVWDEAIAGHLTGGSTGAALNAAGSAGDPWTTALPGAYSAGTAGYIVGNNLNATVSSRSSHSAADVWAVGTRVLTAGTNIALAKGTGVTGFNDLSAADVRTAVGLASANLDTQLAALSTAIDATPTNAELNARTLLAADYATSTALAVVAGYIDTEIQTILTNLADVPTVAEFEARTLVAASYATAASIAALNDISPAEVNAEVLDVLVTDTFAEPAGPLAATASLKDRIGWVAALGRNKLDQNATEFILYADDGTTVLATGACSDDTTTTTRDKLS